MHPQKQITFYGKKEFGKRFQTLNFQFRACSETVRVCVDTAFRIGVCSETVRVCVDTAFRIRVCSENVRVCVDTASGLLS